MSLYCTSCSQELEQPYPNDMYQQCPDCETEYRIELQDTSRFEYDIGVGDIFKIDETEYTVEEVFDSVTTVDKLVAHLVADDGSETVRKIKKLESDFEWIGHSDVPSPIARVPDKYDRLEQHFGVVSNHVNLVYDGHAHRICVNHVLPYFNDLDSVTVDGELTDSAEQGIDEVIDAYKPDDEEGMREATRQSLRFYAEYRDLYEQHFEYDRSNFR